MKTNGKKLIIVGAVGIAAFILWTILIQVIDVQPVGQNGTNIGFASLNTQFHQMTGVNMTLYNLTEWLSLGIVPILTCLFFCGLGLVQFTKRKSVMKVDRDILILGIYYVVIVVIYAIFEVIPINYRPIPIEGVMEASYPSTTTMVVLCVMMTVIFQAMRRLKNVMLRTVVVVITALYTAFMVYGRLFAGVHWLTDILGSIILSFGLFALYKGTVLLLEEKEG